MVVFEGWLPVGSIVHIPTYLSPLMIAAYGAQLPDGTVHDYAGLPYPTGLSDEKNYVAFDRADVDQVLFVGLQQLEGLAALEYLDAHGTEVTVQAQEGAQPEA